MWFAFDRGPTISAAICGRTSLDSTHDLAVAYTMVKFAALCPDIRPFLRNHIAHSVGSSAAVPVLACSPPSHRRHGDSYLGV